MSSGNGNQADSQTVGGTFSGSGGTQGTESVNPQTGEVVNYLVVYAPREYRKGNSILTSWARVGAAFVSKNNTGVNVVLHAVPTPSTKDGLIHLHIRPPFPKSEEDTYQTLSDYDKYAMNENFNNHAQAGQAE
jgi:hypothetical protein